LGEGTNAVNCEPLQPFNGAFWMWWCSDTQVPPDTNWT
jgi:hypothetical protein